MATEGTLTVATENDLAKWLTSKQILKVLCMISQTLSLVRRRPTCKWRGKLLVRLHYWRLSEQLKILKQNFWVFKMTISFTIYLRSSFFQVFTWVNIKVRRTDRIFIRTTSSALGSTPTNLKRTIIIKSLFLGNYNTCLRYVSHVFFSL